MLMYVKKKKGSSIFSEIVTLLSTIYRTFAMQW